METIKAGCYLINPQNQTIALVYREYYNDYTFPKGHMELNETLIGCAIRETEEETKRVPLIINKYKPTTEKYTTSKGENCVCYMYFALDNGKSDNDSWDTHTTYFVHYKKVLRRLTYKSLKLAWKKAIPIVEEILLQEQNK